MAGKTIPLDALTVEDLVNLGPRAVNERLPTSLLVTVARLYVQQRLDQRQRQLALGAERRVYRAAHDGADDTLNAMINAAAMRAASEVTFDWTPLLDVPFLVPSHDRHVTWGLAKIEDHSDRAAWLERLSAGNLRTAIQHRRAIDDIGEAGAETLIGALNAKDVR